jgi:hypothetical protein
MKRGNLKYLVLLMSAAAVFSGCAHISARPAGTQENKTLRFAIIGDRTGTAQPGIYPEIVAEVERMKPELVITVGDMIQGYTDDTTLIKKEWEEYLGEIKPLTMPVYFTPGNHDIGDTLSLKFYERYIGEPYHSFTTKGVHFICLDTGRYDTIGVFPKEQLDWLVDDLERNKNAEHTLVFFHIPYWAQTIAQDKPDTLHKIFVKYGVDGVFSGHYHEYFNGEFDGIKYTAVSSSGGETGPGPTGVQYHFTWITVDKDGVSIAPIKMNSVIPWNEVSVNDFLFIGEAAQKALKTPKVHLKDDFTVPLTQVELTVNNLSKDVTLQDTLRWQAPAGWTITPMDLPISVEPLKTLTAEFTVQCKGRPFPAPTVSLKYTYAQGRKFDLKDALRISRTAYAYQASRPPVIDGNLDEEVWRNPVTGLFAPEESPASADPVSFYFAWDSNNLYVAARCTEMKMDSITAKAKEHDGAVYGDDCVGYFLQADSGDTPIYQVYFNPLGVCFDQKITTKDGIPIAADRQWNGTYEAKTSSGKDYWVIEARIPLEQLGARAEPGKTWAVNFRRKQPRLKTSADWIVPIGYDPGAYGTLLMK